MFEYNSTSYDKGNVIWYFPGGSMEIPTGYVPSEQISIINSNWKDGQ